MKPNDPLGNDSEIRKDYYRDKYVIIAPKRNMRPDSFSHDAEPHKVPNPTCPFCTKKEASILSIPNATDWRVKVIANAFPALTTDNARAFGAQEVVIDTPSHDLEFSELPVPHILEIFSAYKQRLEALGRIPGIRYVLVFKNDGPMAGASVAHAHCQIIALPLIPPHIESESDDLTRYREEHGSCALCDVIAWEEKQRVRIVYSDKHVVAVSPYAATSGFGTWLIPRKHHNRLADLNHPELRSLATCLKMIASRLDSTNISFNYFLQESVSHLDHHFVIKVEPRIFKWAGAEMGTGVVINPIAPEYAALWYRGKV